MDLTAFRQPLRDLLFRGATLPRAAVFRPGLPNPAARPERPATAFFRPIALTISALAAADLATGLATDSPTDLATDFLGAGLSTEASPSA